MINFSKPPDKNINWNIWNPLVSRDTNKYITLIILSVTACFTVALTVLLLKNPYNTAIYGVLYNIIYKIFAVTDIVIFKMLSVVIVLTYILILTGLHEITHIICYPAFWRKPIYVFFDKQIYGVTLFYDGEISRERRIWLNLMPMVVLSCGMLIISIIVDGNLRYMFQITAFINVALSSADIIGVFLLLRLPPKAVLYNGIWKYTAQE